MQIGILYKIAIYTIVYLLIQTTIYAEFGWYEQTSTTSKFLYGVFFKDSLNGWAVGDEGIILHTSNGGTNWEIQETNVGSWLLGIHFVDNYNGWAVGDFGRIEHTSNGGSTWELQNSGVYPKGLNSVFFVNKLKGFAVGAAGMIYTNDGGKNWYSNISSTFSATKKIFFFNETFGWACGANGTIIRTLDGGKNWEKQKTPVTSTIYDIYFLNPSRGWALSRYEPKLITTTNGGKNWTVVNNNINGFFKKIHFFDENIAWAVGPDGIIRTSDGGKNWEVQISALRYNLWSASFLNKNIAWAVGGDGKILKTNNGGEKFIIDFIANVTSGNAPLSTTFTDLTQGNVTNWYWEFGDGGTHTTQNPVYIYQQPGNYTVSLTVSNGIERKTKTKIKYIRVLGKNDLIADFTADTTNGTEPLTIKFKDLSIGNPDSWFWNFGDGSTHTAQNPIHVYQNSGKFSVSLEIKRNGKNDKKIKKDYIIVHKKTDTKEKNINNYFKLISFSPNPAVSNLKIEFELYKPAYINLSVYDLSGNFINLLINDYKFPGRIISVWNFKDEKNFNIPAGKYFFVLNIKSLNIETKIIKSIIYLK